VHNGNDVGVVCGLFLEVIAFLCKTFVRAIIAASATNVIRYEFIIVFYIIALSKATVSLTFHSKEHSRRRTRILQNSKFRITLNETKTVKLLTNSAPAIQANDFLIISICMTYFGESKVLCAYIHAYNFCMTYFGAAYVHIYTYN